MKKSLLFSAAMIVSAVAAVAQSGQTQWYRLVSHCTLANDVRTNACVELINDASVTLTGNNMNTQNDRLWGAPQVDDMNYEYQLWTLEEDPDNEGVYAIVCKAAPDGSVNATPSIAQDNTGRWDYDRTARHYVFQLGHEEIDGDGNKGYSIRSKEQGDGFYWNMAANGQGYSINNWNDPADSKGGLFFFVPVQSADADVDRAAIEAFRNVLPGAGELVDAALSRLDSATTEEDVASIKEGLVADLQQCAADLAADQVYLTINNVRRGSLGQASHLAVLADNAINTVAQPESESVWTLVETATAGTYLLYNVKTDSYLGGSGSAPAMVGDDEAVAYTLEFLDNGYITFYPAGTDKFINVDTNGNSLVYYSFANDAGANWQLAELPMTDLYTEEEYDVLARWVDVIPGDGSFADDSNGNALTRFSVTFPCAARYTGLANGIVAIASGSQAAYYCDIDMSNITYDEETHTFTCELAEPLTDYAYFYVQVNKYAFELTDDEGNVSYTDYMYSNYAFCFYVPDQIVPLSVTPAPGEVDALWRIEMWLPDTNYDLNVYGEDLLTVTRGNEELLAVTADDIWDNYLEDEEGYARFYVDVDETEAGTYTLTVPENFFRGNTGRSERTVVTWTITDTGLSDVTVNGRPSVIHDLQGRKLNRIVRGVNIVDGVKTLAR